MRCQSCGKEIADKAIICYRCGAPTAIPERPAPPAPVGQADRSLAIIVLLIVLLAGGGGLLYWQEAPPWTYAALAGAVTAAVVGLRVTRRRPPA